MSVQENIESNLAEEIEELLPPDAVCLSVKVNLAEDEYDEKNFTPPYFASILAYLKDSGVAVLASTAGVHKEGRNQIPHIHYHFICERFSPPSNPSQHRKRWLSKKDNDSSDLGEASFKYQKLDTRYPKYQFLSYPLKEGLMVPKFYYPYLMTFDGKKMSNEMIDFLKKVGQTIYQTQAAIRLRQEKSQQRKQLALQDLYEICKDHTFPSFKAMLIWLDENYIDGLDLDEYPDPKNYKVNCQKVAVRLGLLKYSEL